MKMKRNLLYYIIGAAALILPYQNCARSGVGFSIDADSEYNIYGALPSHAKVVDIQPQESVEYPSTKLVLIVDNSSTMAQSQQELSEKIDGLLNAMSGKRVTVYLMSTSSYWNPWTSVYGVVENGVERDVASESELVPGNINYVNNIYGSGLYPIVLNPTDAESVRKASLDKIKNNIRQMGTTGRDNESGLCSLVQFASHRKLAVEPNEKLVYFLLTDEDNYAAANHCRKDLLYYYKHYQRYTYYGTLVKYTYSFEGYRDGVSSNIQTVSSFSITTPVVQNPSAYIDQQCQDSDRQASATRVANMVGKSAYASGYTYQVTSATLTGCSYIKQLGHLDLPAGDFVDYCVNPYAGYPTMMEFLYANRKDAIPNQPCNRSLVASGRDLYRLSYYLDSPDIAAKALQDLSASKVGDNYFMAIVTNVRRQSCALKEGQSYGDVFERMQQLKPSAVKTYSICTGDNGYQEAFKEIAASVSYVTQEFPLEIPDGMEVKDVLLTRQGDTTPIKVDATQYEVVDGTIKFRMKLSGTDKLHVVIF